jgi:hypothetical protein
VDVAIDDSFRASRCAMSRAERHIERVLGARHAWSTHPRFALARPSTRPAIAIARRTASDTTVTSDVDGIPVN